MMENHTEEQGGVSQTDGQMDKFDQAVANLGKGIEVRRASRRERLSNNTLGEALERQYKKNGQVIKNILDSLTGNRE